MSRKSQKPMVIGALLASSLGLADPTFAMRPLAQGYMLGAAGDSKAANPDDKAKGDSREAQKAAEGCCGTAKKQAEGKCGEGRCGGAKCGDAAPSVETKASGEESRRKGKRDR